MEKDGRTIGILKCMTCGQTEFAGATLEDKVAELGRHARRNLHAVQFLPGEALRLDGPLDVPAQGSYPSASASPSPPTISSGPSWRPQHVASKPHDPAISEPTFTDISTHQDNLSLASVLVGADEDDD